MLHILLRGLRITEIGLRRKVIDADILILAVTLLSQKFDDITGITRPQPIIFKAILKSLRNHSVTPDDAILDQGNFLNELA